jgi:DNA uptake protein ComE-like DNA-binding protein
LALTINETAILTGIQPSQKETANTTSQQQPIFELVPAARALDLNSAAAQELNAAGGGMIGRAIVKGRPYRSVDELLTKRIINRSTFDLIKKQISVRT